MYSRKTRSIEVTVKPMYLDDQSSPPDDHYVWAYRVRIDNQGIGDRAVAVAVLAHHGRDGPHPGSPRRGGGRRATGPATGPVLRVHERNPAAHAVGIMLGRYEMESERGERFEIDIPAFSLDSPYQRKSIN